jgi:hypothetical protein
VKRRLAACSLTRPLDLVPMKDRTVMQQPSA